MTWEPRVLSHMPSLTPLSRLEFPYPGKGKICSEPTFSPASLLSPHFGVLSFPSPLHRLEYKYSKLVMNASLKDYDLPAADSCAIMEGEDVEDDLLYTSKKTLFGKIKSFTSKVGGLASAPRSAWRAGEDTSPRAPNGPTLFPDHRFAPHLPHSSVPHTPKNPGFCLLYFHTNTLFPGAQGCS